MEKSELIKLPEDLMVSILQRLSLICNLRLRCVCKAWHSLLSNPSFIYKTLTCTDCDDDRVLMNSYGNRNGFCHISDDSRSPLAIPYVEHWPACLWIVGSCNGLICLTDHRVLILVWNPLTRQIKFLPFSTEIFEAVRFEAGFCFDAGANDHKVIKMNHMMSMDPKFDFNIVFLYSLASGYWTKLHVSLGILPLPLWTPINSAQKFYHWVGEPPRTPSHFRDDFSFVVLSFDSELELFKTTEIPYRVNNYVKEVDIGLFMLKEYLAISASPVVGAPIFEISVLVKVGVKESWVKLIKIGPIVDGLRILNPWKKGKLFVKTSKGEVKLCDPFTGEVAIVSSSGGPPQYLTELVSYKATQQRIGYLIELVTYKATQQRIG